MRTGTILTSLFFCWFTSCLDLATCQSQHGLISPSQANRSGLVVNWFSQMDATDANSIVELLLVVDEDRATTFFQISGGRLSETISEFDLSPFGKPFGVEGAKEFAGIRKEIFEAMLKRDQVEAEVKIEQYSIPDTTLYSITSTGMLNAVDAETGKLRWKARVGDRNLPTIGMGANKSFIAVVNGSNVHCLESRTGKQLWQQRLKDSISASPVLNDKFVFVPLDSGRLQLLPLDTQGYGHSMYVALGNPVRGPAPILEGTSVAWATSRGVTVAPSDEVGSLRFRINTESPVVCSPVARNGIFFVASSQGSIYAVSESGAELFWQFPTGEQVSLTPIPLGDDLFVITESRNLHCFDARTGGVKPGWETPMPNVVLYVGASENYLYLLDSLGQLVTVDRNTGASLGKVSSNLSLRTFSNLQSDRLYICHETGLIQCLREAASERPKFLSGEWTEVAMTDVDAATKPATDAEPSSNPFDMGNSNPFQGGGNAAPATDDPFGGGSDPFSGGGAAGQQNNAAANNLPAANKLTVWSDVEPVFKKRCGTCHGGQNPKGGLDASSVATLLRGGDSGEPIKAGDAKGSRLYQLITHADEPKMPLDGNKIPNAEIKLIEAWINSGALETQPAAAAGTTPPPAAGGGDDPFAGK